VVTLRINSTNDVPVSVDDSYTLNEGATLTINTLTGVLANDTDPKGSPLTTRKVTDPKHGTISLNPDGSFSYIHDGSESISDSLSYRAYDGTDNGNTATVRFKIIPVNDPPVSISDRYTLKEGEKIEITAANGVLVNDSDAEGSKLTAAKLTDPVHGQLIFNPEGGFSYQHDGSESVQDSFSYKVNDGIVDGNRTTIYFTIAPVNDSPLSVSDIYSDSENDTITIDTAAGLLSNDTDAEGDKLTVIKVSDPIHGKLLLNKDGSFTYVNDGSEANEDHFTYRAFDGQAEGNIASVTIALNSVNDPPVAEADSYTIEEGGTLTVTSEQGLLANDKDPEGSVLKAEKVTDSSHGKLTLNADGSFLYIHDGSESTGDSFTYRANDGILGSNNVKVTISVTPVNDSPIAMADVATVNEDTKLQGKSVLSNDGDPENNSLSISISPVSGPSHGNLVINSDGTYNYIPDLNFNGTDNFIYKICDNGSPSQCSTAQVTITIVPVNDAPIAIADDASVSEHQVLNGTSVLANDSDPDGDPLSINTTAETAPQHGSLKINADGTYVYTPNAGYSGDDSFVYRICDNAVSAGCSNAKVTIHVKEINDPPVAVSDQAVMNEDEILQGSSLLSNDSDPEGNTFSIDTNPVISPTHGQVTIRPNGTFTYTPSADFNGNDSFTYRICDNGTPQACSTAIVSITINAVEDNPVAANDNFDLKENQAFTGNLLANDSNPDSGNLSISKDPVVAPAHGTLMIADNGDFTYKPIIDFIGTDSFTYQIYNPDKPFLKATATVVVMVGKDNQCQVFVPNSFSPNGDGIHDLFKIRCLYNYENPVIEVFNRWGSLVYKKEHYGDNDYWGSDEESWWDGQSDRKLNIGRNLPAGTYYYVLTLQKTKVMTGFIYLNR
jgi:gliding motility-associated-like protein